VLCVVYAKVISLLLICLLERYSMTLSRFSDDNEAACDIHHTSRTRGLHYANASSQILYQNQTSDLPYDYEVEASWHRRHKYVFQADFINSRRLR